MFKKITVISTLFILLLGHSASAQIRNTASARKFGLGVSTVPLGATTGASLTAWINLNDKAGIQTFLGVGATSGGSGIGLGGIYKINVIGSTSSGVHVGGGMRLGSEASTFFFDLLGNAGVHFSLPSMDQIYFSFDAGPGFALAGPRSFNFTLTPYSFLLGASVIYMF